MRYLVSITIEHEKHIFDLACGETPMSEGWKNATVAMAKALPGYRYHSITECPPRTNLIYDGDVPRPC